MGVVVAVGGWGVGGGMHSLLKLIIIFVIVPLMTILFHCCNRDHTKSFRMTSPSSDSNKVGGSLNENDSLCFTIMLL